MSIAPKMEYSPVKNISDKDITLFRYSPVFGNLIYTIKPGETKMVDNGTVEDREASHLERSKKIKRVSLFEAATGTT